MENGKIIKNNLTILTSPECQY